jgi:hypothetical protein
MLISPECHGGSARRDRKPLTSLAYLPPSKFDADRSMMVTMVEGQMTTGTMAAMTAGQPLDRGPTP